jgi:hypothetical protein
MDDVELDLDRADRLGCEGPAIWGVEVGAMGGGENAAEAFG